jgi:hypothetical protein
MILFNFLKFISIEKISSCLISFIFFLNIVFCFILIYFYKIKIKTIKNFMHKLFKYIKFNYILIYNLKNIFYNKFEYKKMFYNFIIK